MVYKKVEVKKKPGPKTEEPGQTYRVWLRPSVNEKIIERHGTLTAALMKQFEADNKKDKRTSK